MIPLQNQENHEIRKIPRQKHENHENSIIPARITKFMKFVEFHLTTMKIMKI